MLVCLNQKLFFIEQVRQRVRGLKGELHSKIKLLVLRETMRTLADRARVMECDLGYWRQEAAQLKLEASNKYLLRSLSKAKAQVTDSRGILPPSSPTIEELMEFSDRSLRKTRDVRRPRFWGYAGRPLPPAPGVCDLPPSQKQVESQLVETLSSLEGKLSSFAAALSSLGERISSLEKRMDAGFGRRRMIVFFPPSALLSSKRRRRRHGRGAEPAQLSADLVCRERWVLLPVRKRSLRLLMVASAASKKKADAVRAVKRRLPQILAVVLFAPSGELSRAMTETRNKIKLAEVGIFHVRPRRVPNKSMIIEIPDIGSEANAKAFASKMWEIF